jgi:hypothetical protein
MVSHCLSIAAMTGLEFDVLFELFKAGFYFPSRSKYTIILNESVEEPILNK